MANNRYKICEDVTVLYVFSKGTYLEVLIDTEDLDKVMSFEGRWTVGTGGYIISKDISGERKSRRLHRVVTDAKTGYEVDHINHNRHDNRKSNLRVVTKSVNLQNLKGAKKNNKSTGVRNVCFHKRIKKYQVKMQVNKRAIHGGFYDTLEEAAEVATKLRAIVMEGAEEHGEINVEEKLHELLPTHRAISTNRGTGVKNVYYEPNVRGSKKYKVMMGNDYHGRYKTLEEADEVARKLREEKYWLKE